MWGEMGLQSPARRRDGCLDRGGGEHLPRVELARSIVGADALDGVLLRLLLVAALLLSGCGRTDVPETTNEPTAFHEDLLLVQAGDLPILLVAPHAGRPENHIPGVPRRTGRSFLSAESALRAAKWGGFSTGCDYYTDRLTERVSQQLESDLGRRPYVVMARFNRAYVDANRPPEDAFEHDLAEPYYRAYHEAIERFVREIQERWGRGLLLDVHGNSTDLHLIHFGTREGRTAASFRTIYGATASEGPNSIPGVLRARGHAVYPPPGEPEGWYFSGGYTEDRYGTMAGGLDAIQLEIGYAYMRSEKRADRLAPDLAAALRTFHDAFLPTGDR